MHKGVTFRGRIGAGAETEIGGGDEVVGLAPRSERVGGDDASAHGSCVLLRSWVSFAAIMKKKKRERKEKGVEWARTGGRGRKDVRGEWEKGNGLYGDAAAFQFLSLSRCLYGH